MTVLKISRADKPLHYLVAYRLVAETPWLDQQKRRDALVRLVVKLGVRLDVVVTNVQVHLCGISFEMATERHQDLNMLVNRFGFMLARTLDQVAPELHLHRLVGPRRSIAGIWSHPYYVQTLTDPNARTLKNYFNE